MNPFKISAILLASSLFSANAYSQLTDQYSPDFKNPKEIKGMKLVWNDEFNYNGKPDSSNWIFENGFVRNEELQWYKPGNANCANGLLTIEGRKEKIKNPDWTKKFHVWRMDWNKDTISLFLDDQLLNTSLLNQTVNPDGFNPFLQPHFLLLNLALGRNGGDPSKTSFPIKYEIDYVRVYQKK